MLTEAEQTATGIARFEEAVELVLGLSTVEQLGGRTEQQGIGRGLSVQFLCPGVLGGVFGQLLLDQTLIEKFEKQGQNVRDAQQV